MRLKWEDAFEARPSKNVRGEAVFDIFRKNTEEMLYSDIPAMDLDKIKKQMSDLIDHIATEEIEVALGKEPEVQKTEPVGIGYDRLRGFYSGLEFEEDKK